MKNNFEVKRKCCGCCKFAKLELDLEKETASRTCSFTGEYVSLNKSCKNWVERVMDVSNNPAVIDFYENKDKSEIAHTF